jgi:hypothetical protein
VPALPVVETPRNPVTTSHHGVDVRLETGGHLTGSLDQTVDETTDVHAFLFDQLGLGYPASGG